MIAGHSGGATSPARRQARSGTEEIKVIGVRRVIAERMSAAKRNIPHFAYVEEVDVTELEALRQYLNSRQPKGAPSLTYLPFLVAALVRVLDPFPQCMPARPSAIHRPPPRRHVASRPRHGGQRCRCAKRGASGLATSQRKSVEYRKLHRKRRP